MLFQGLFKARANHVKRREFGSIRMFHSWIAFGAYTLILHLSLFYACWAGGSAVLSVYVKPVSGMISKRTKST